MLDITKKEMAIQILHRNWDEVIAGEAECEGIAECQIEGLKSQILKDGTFLIKGYRIPSCGYSNQMYPGQQP